MLSVATRMNGRRKTELAPYAEVIRKRFVLLVTPGPNADVANQRDIGRMSDVIDCRARCPRKFPGRCNREVFERAQQQVVRSEGRLFPRNLLVEVAQHNGSLRGLPVSPVLEPGQPNLVILPWNAVFTAGVHVGAGPGNARANHNEWTFDSLRGPSHKPPARNPTPSGPDQHRTKAPTKARLLQRSTFRRPSLAV